MGRRLSARMDHVFFDEWIKWITKKKLMDHNGSQKKNEWITMDHITKSREKLLRDKF